MGFIRRNLRPGLTTVRIEAFSDAVFAISITLLVLTIAVPELTSIELSQGLLLKRLIALWPKFLSFFISFVIIGIFWIGHNMMFHLIKRSDRNLLLINILLLMLISFIPFPAALLGEYSKDKYALILYGSTLITLGFLYVFLWLYASRSHRLIEKTISPEIIRKATYILLIAPLAYIAAVILAFVNPLITLVIYVVIPIAYIIPSPIDDFVDYVFQYASENSTS